MTGREFGSIFWLNPEKDKTINEINQPWTAPDARRLWPGDNASPALCNDSIFAKVTKITPPRARPLGLVVHEHAIPRRRRSSGGLFGGIRGDTQEAI